MDPAPVTGRRGLVLPLLLGVLVLMEALASLLAVHAQRVRRAADTARARVLVRAALVEAWGEVAAAGSCLAASPTELVGVSAAGTSFVIRRTPVDSALALVVVEAWVAGAARGRVVRLVRRAPGCIFTPAPPLPPPA